MKQGKSGFGNAAQRRMTITLALAMLLASLGTSIANIALPSLATAFSAPFAQVQAVVAGYLAALTVTVIVAGRLGDRFGLKRGLTGGLGLFAMASLLCAVAPGLWWLVGARVLQGIGAAFLMTLSMALMRQTAAPAQLGRALGLLGTVSALGTALGPALGGLLIPLAGWQGLFWLQLPLALVALVLAITTLPGHAGKTNVPSASLSRVLDRTLVPSLLINGLVAAVMMTTLVVGPFYLSLRLGLSAAQVGFIMAVGPVISILSGLPSGRLVDAMGSTRVLTSGLVLLAAGALLLAFLPNLFGVPGYLLPIFLLTPGYQLFQAANNTATLADVSADRRGTVSGVLNLSRNTGLMAGASGMGMLFAFGAGTGKLSGAGPAAIASGMQLTFLTAAGMIAIALAIHHHSGRSRPKAPLAALPPAPAGRRPEARR